MPAERTPDSLLRSLAAGMHAVYDPAVVEHMSASAQQMLVAGTEISEANVGRRTAGPLIEHLDVALTSLQQALICVSASRRHANAYLHALGMPGMDAGLSRPYRQPPLELPIDVPEYVRRNPICSEAVQPVSELSEEQRQLVRERVVVQVLYAEHGRVGMIGAQPDKDTYGRLEQAVQALDPARGDVLMVEGAEHKETNGAGAVAAAYINPTVSRASTEQKRAERKIDTFDYATRVAMLAMVPVFQADISDAELEQWRKESRTLLQQAVSFALGSEARSILDFREQRVAAKVAGMALRMAQENRQDAHGKPVLQVVFGSGHRYTLTVMLRSMGLEPEITVLERGRQ